MGTLETAKHLFQRPQYLIEQSNWDDVFLNVLKPGPSKLTYDISGIMSVLAYSYPCGDRTLFQEISRKPWLSRTGNCGEIRLEDIPQHGLTWDSPENIASHLFTLLCAEAQMACEGRHQIYILLSGGLDSRIVAGVLSHLYKQGTISQPIGVTWGLEDSRDVHYGRAVAEQCDFKWEHISIGPESVMENITEGFPMVAGLVPPSHLHRMLWFKNVPKDALVLAGSYGDSIGRAEFSGRHVLELNYLSPFNPFGLIQEHSFQSAADGVVADLKSLRSRAGDVPHYVKCEYEMQCHYMRGMIAQVMSVINSYCSLYQMFTAPEVYGYIWSLHPARRDDSIYAAMLENQIPELARIPWARTNKALSGKTVGADSSLQKEFHNYAQWCSGPLYDRIRQLIEPSWYASTGIFNPARIEKLSEGLRGSNCFDYLGFHPYDLWLWLAGFRLFVDRIEEAGNKVEVASFNNKATIHDEIPEDTRSKLRRYLSSKKILYKNVAKIRKWYLKKKAIRTYPPQFES